MTRYCLQHRETGRVWPLPPEHPEGFPTATDAVMWATENGVDVRYFAYPFTPNEATKP